MIHIHTDILHMEVALRCSLVPTVSEYVCPNRLVNLSLSARFGCVIES